jgi:lysophospholipase L1-like esterase
MDDEVLTEKCVNDSQRDNEHWGLDTNWMRIDELSLQGDISVSKSGTWIINGADTGVKALGPKGDNGLTPWMKTIDNKLYYSYDNQTWELASDYIAAWFRFTGTSGSSQANNIGKIQISRDEGKTWADLSGTFTNNLHIKGYVATTSDLPSSAVQGDIYGVGPTYAESDTEHTNPIYKLFVKNENVWVDNGQFTSIAAGVVQELGESETEVVSQKTVTENLVYDVSKFNVNTDGTNKFTLLEAALLVPNFLRTPYQRIKFISSTTGFYETWMWRGNQSWTTVSSKNYAWINITNSYLPSDVSYLNSSGIVNARISTLLPFLRDRLVNMTTTKLDLSWEIGKYYTIDGTIAENELYAITTVDISSYKGGSLFGIIRTTGLTYNLIYEGDTIINSFQTGINDSISIDIPKNATTLKLSHRIADLPTDSVIIEVSNSRIYTAAKYYDVSIIKQVLPWKEYPTFTWEQGGIDASGGLQQSDNVNYPNRIRTTSMLLTDNGKLILSIDNGYGYRVFEYTPDLKFVLWKGFENGGTNEYVLQDSDNKIKFNILHSDGSSIDPDEASICNFTVKGIRGFIPDTYDEIASKKDIEAISLVGVRNNLKNKKVSFIGDSITYGVGGENSPYHKVFCDLYDCIDNPLGVSGTCIANNTKNNLGSQRFITRATVENLSGSSLIVVFGGTNDFSYDSKPIGELFIEGTRATTDYIGDKTITAPTDTDTFAGALHELINTIRTNCPNIPIVFMTPLQRGRYSADRPVSNETNSQGNWLSDFSKAMKEICSFYSIPVLDLGAVSELDFLNDAIASKYSIDKLHPNVEGHNIIGNLLYRFIEQNVIIH